jgi:hypothetical protein
MIYPEFFGADIWVIPNGANQLFLIRLPQDTEEKYPLFGAIKYHQEKSIITTQLNDTSPLEKGAPPALHMLYQRGSHETEMNVLSLTPLKNLCVEIGENKFFLTSYEAAIVPTAQGKSDASALYKKQLILELALAWQQKQNINIAVRFGALFEYLEKGKNKVEEVPKSKLIVPNNKIIVN